MKWLKYFNPKSIYWQKLSLELIVVFLGVTAGFLFDNWRMARQQSILEQKYIQGFSQDLESNIKEFREAQSSDSVWIARTTPLLEKIKNDEIQLDSAKIIMSHIVQISRINATTGTYQDITNSGNLNLIRDFNLKTSLVDYHLELDGIQFIDDYFYQFFGDFVMPFVFREFSVLTGKFNNPDVIHSGQFANVFAGYYSLVQQRIQAYGDLLNKSYTIKRMLN